MSPGALAARASFLVMVALAIRLARTSALPSHRPVAELLGLALAVDVLRGLGGPLALQRALYLLFPLLSVELALEVFGHRPLRRELAGFWLLLAGAVAILDLPRRDDGLQVFFLHVHVVSLTVQLLAAVPLLRARRVPGVSQTIALLLLAGDLAELFGPWRRGVPAQDWEVARWQWTLVYVAATVVQARRLRWIARLGFSRSGAPPRS